MKKTISIGKQSFSSLREHDNFFVDKTNFIKEWWEKEDDITLIARPRRFGKTLNMSMLECFFSNKYANRADLFEGLSIWEEEKYRQLQGTYPVIFLSFASVKADNLTEAKIQIKQEIAVLYEENRYLLKKDILSDNERRLYNRTTEQMDDTTAQKAIRNMAAWMHRYYGKNVIILLDEYDTPMQEAYVQGYWDEFTSFVRSLFNASFKTNPYLERAVMMETPFDMLVHCGDVEGREIFIEALVDCPCCIVAGNNDFFSDLPREEEIELDGNKVLVTHGNYYGVSMDISGVAEEAKSRDCDAVFFGHTHKPVIEEIDGVLAINPGSLSYPRQEGRQPSYAIMEIDRRGKVHFTIAYLRQ